MKSYSLRGYCGRQSWHSSLVLSLIYALTNIHSHSAGRDQTLKDAHLARQWLKMKSLDLVPGTPGFLTTFNTVVATPSDYFYFLSLWLLLSFNMTPKITCPINWCSVLSFFIVFLIYFLMLVLIPHFFHFLCWKTEWTRKTGKELTKWSMCLQRKWGV